jgi:diguanylate cyclase (GGDEF)-like protein/PAS domain S-box-containing protein
VKREVARTAKVRQTHIEKHVGDALSSPLASSATIELLLVEDSPGDASLVQQALSDATYAVEVSWVRTLAEADAHLDNRPAECVLLDLGLPDACGFEGLDALLLRVDAPAIIVLTGDSDTDRGVEAVQRGAEDYLDKSRADVRGLQQAVSYALERSRSRATLQRALAHSKAVLAALADGVLVRDERAILASMNPAAERMLNVTADELNRGALPDRWRTIWPDGSAFSRDDYPGVVTARTGEPQHNVVLGVERPDRGLVWLEINSYPLREADQDSPLIGAVTSFRDVTSRRAAEEATRFQAALLDAVGQAVIATDPSGKILYWNRQAEVLYGWSAAEVAGRSVLEVTPALRSAMQAEELMTALGQGQSWTGDLLARRRDGTTFPAMVTNTPVLDAEGQLVAVIGVSSDITERQRAEEAMRQLSHIVASSGDAIIGKDLSGKIISWNRAAERLYGYLAEDVIGKHISVLAPPERLDELAGVLENIRAGQTVSDLETQRRHRDGRILDVALTVSPVYDASSNLIGASAIARDVTERKQMQYALEHQALHDALTGLPNRVLAGDRLQHALVASARTQTPVAVLFLDLDNFKNINDATGHQTGDAVLVEVARRLQCSIRPGDTVARFGGDEFVILCEGADEESAAVVANRCLEALADPIDVGARTIYVSASLGIAVSPPLDGSDLLRFADAAMYDAKARGRSRAVVFDQRLAHSADERWQLSNDLRQAIDTDSLQLWYQPIVDLTTGALLGLEALCRWEHPTLGMVPPDRFVAVAEETGLSTLLDTWVLRTACAATREFMSAGLFAHSGHVAVNISARSLGDAELDSAVRAAVTAAGIPFRALTLEVTETGVMADPDRAVRLLQELQSLGTSIALDDFGTGYSSLTYLRRLPVSTIKIDRSFIREMEDDPDDMAIVVSIIDLANSVHLTVVAEGIETPAQLSLLRGLGCAAGQGFLWSQPMPAAEVLTHVIAARTDGGSWPTPGLPLQSPSERRRRSLPVLPEHGLTRLMQLHHQGASLSTIAAALNQQGFKTPGGQRWHRTSVARTIADIVHPNPRRSAKEYHAV